MEPSAGKIGSSTMPHKRNPIHSEWIMVLERKIRSQRIVALEVMSQENERDASRWKNEWIAVPESFVYLSGLLNHMTVPLEGLTVEEAACSRTRICSGGCCSPSRLCSCWKSIFLCRLPTKRFIWLRAGIRERGTYLIDELMSDPEVAAQCQARTSKRFWTPPDIWGKPAEVAHAVKSRVDRQLAGVRSHRKVIQRMVSTGDVP